MSTAAVGASSPPPNQPPNDSHERVVESNSTVSVKDGTYGEWHRWSEDKKTKTCKCASCNDRVKSWSWKCSCLNHICSECLDPASAKSQLFKDRARDEVFVSGCWSQWTSKMNIQYSKRYMDALPPKRPLEDQQAKEQKVRAKEKKKAKEEAEAKKQKNTPTAGHSKVSNGDPDEEYEALQGGEPSSSNTKDLRAVIPRAYAEDDDESLQQSDEPVPKKRKIRDPKDYLAQGRTVIIGSGVVGMFLARELALRVKEAKIEHEVMVVETRKNCFDLASAHCNGFLSTKGMPEVWNPIWEKAKKFWEEFILDAELRKGVEFSSGRSFLAKPSDSDIKDPRVPGWLQSAEKYYLEEDPEEFGRLTPLALAGWLGVECDTLGVQFRRNAWVSNIIPNGPFIAGVTISSPGPDIPVVVNERCENLIIAAGPYTTGILKELFSNHGLHDLANWTYSAEWVRLRMPDQVRVTDIAIRIPTTTVNTEGSDEIALVPRSSDDHEYLTLSSKIEASTDVVLDFKSGLTDGDSSRELRKCVSNYVSMGNTDVDEHSIRTGSVKLSTGKYGNPIIDRVPPSGLGKVCTDEEDQHPGGVWLCYGFGSHGTMLAPGAARMVVDRMFGEPSGVEDDDFTIPWTYQKPKPVLEAESIGKGKAKGKEKTMD